MSVLVEAWKWEGVSDWSAIIEGQIARVRYVAKVRHAEPGNVYEIETFDHITFDRESKVEEFVQFLDTAQLGRIMGEIAALEGD